MSATTDKGDADASIFDPELLRRFGITRVGDVTGLDIVGIPVWFAVRPNSRGLSVSQGKGLVPAQARLSAVMEAIEGAVAEDTRRHTVAFGSIHDMRDKGFPLIPFESVGRVDMDMLDPQRERAWVKGTSVRRQQEIYAPFELIGMDFRADFPWDRQAFLMSSQGLAAGFNHDHVVLHALQELIENDACFLVDAFETRAVSPRPILLPAGVETSFDRLVRHLSDLGLPPSFFDMTNALGVPVQSRLTDVSGARDDLSPLRYRRDGVASKPVAPGANQAEQAPGSLDLSRFETFLPPWRQLAEHLFAHGIDDVHVFTLKTGLSGLHVVRVLASGLAPLSRGMQRLSQRTLEGFLKAGRTT